MTEQSSNNVKILDNFEFYFSQVFTSSSHRVKSKFKHKLRYFES